MKIAVVQKDYCRTGGIARYSAELTDRLARNHEVHIFTSSWTDDISPDVVPHKVPTFGPPSTSISIFARRATKALSRENFDIILNQGVTACLVQDVLAAHSCQRAALEVLGKENGTMYSFLKKLQPKNRVVLNIEKKNYTGGKFERIIASSHGLKGEITRFYSVSPELINVIPSGVDIDYFTPKNRKRFSSEFRKQWGIDDNDFLICFVAWEFQRKGLDYIVKALPSMDAKLLVVGKGDMSHYNKLVSSLGVKDQLIFVPPAADLRPHYAASDAFVFPTAYEAFSLATLEAVASGLPVIATKVNGTDELIDDGKNGFFIERDAKHIAEKVNLLIDDKKLLRGMGKNARKSAEGYSWDIITKKTLDVYNEILKTKQGD